MPNEPITDKRQVEGLSLNIPCQCWMLICNYVITSKYDQKVYLAKHWYMKLHLCEKSSSLLLTGMHISYLEVGERAQREVPELDPKQHQSKALVA